MKNIQIAIAILLSVTLFSCDLDRLPKGTISSEKFWNNENDVKLALMGCYVHIGGSVYEAYQDGYADNSYCQYPWESNAPLIGAGNISTDMNEGYSYASIRRFNYFLDNVDKVQTMDSKLREQYKAEVRVLRAWKYFNLTNKFGPMPLFKNMVVKMEDAKVKPTPEAEIVEFALKEIKESIPYLPDVAVKSRFTKGAAKAIQARIELVYGRWADAAKTTSEIMQMGYKLFQVEKVSAADYQLNDYTQFIDFKDEKDKEAFYKGLNSYQQQFWDIYKENSEVILNSEFGGDNYNYIAPFFLSDNAGGGWSSITPTVELVNAYWSRDGKPFLPPTKEARKAAYNNGNYTDEYLKEFKNRDTRLYATILFPGAIWNELLGKDKFVWPKIGANLSATGYNYRKLVDPENDLWHKVQDFPLIRYAEVLLSYAEAKNELSGPDNSVFEALDQIRERVNMPKIDRAANSTKESLRETIRNERRLELATEGLRWIDTRRWGISKDVMKTIYAIDGDLVQERKWEEKFRRLPYPQIAVDLNPNLADAQKEKGY